MPHPVEIHLGTLKMLLDRICADLTRETDRVKRTRLAEHIDGLKWAMRHYRLGIEAEQRVFAALSGPHEPTQ
jgi:hypothetical protein